MLSDEQVKELRRLVSECRPRMPKVLWFPHESPAVAAMLVMLVESAPALIAAHDDAVRLRKKMDRVRMFLQWMADYEKSPPEIVKDDFAYDRLMSWMKRSCGEWASKCEAALRPAGQGGG